MGISYYVHQSRAQVKSTDMKHSLLSKEKEKNTKLALEAIALQYFTLLIGFMIVHNVTLKYYTIHRKSKDRMIEPDGGNISSSASQIYFLITL